MRRLASLPLPRWGSGCRRLSAGLDGFVLPSSQGGELNDIVKLELLEQESPAQCAAIWETHHADASRGRLGATLGAGAWRAVQALAAKKCGCEAPLRLQAG